MVGHRRTDSSTSAASATSATSTATTVAIPKQPIKQSADIYVLIEVARERSRAWNRSDEDDKVELSMEISDLIYQIGEFMKPEGNLKPTDGKAYIKAKKSLIEIMEMPL